MSANRSLALAIATLGVLASCSDSKSISSASSDAVPTTAASTVPVTEVPATTVVVETTVPATAPPTPVCVDTTAPSADAESVTIVDGDWNGDGAIDSGVSWVELGGSGANWFIRAEVTGGESSTVALGDLGASYAQALDNVDVDFALGAEPGTNRDELLAIVGGGASALNLGIFGVGADGCIFQFDDGAGAPFLAPIGGTVHQRSGLMCDGGAGSQFLVALNASTFDDLTWDTVDHRIEREGDHSLVLGVALEGTLLAIDPALERYSQAECGGTVLVG